MREPSGRLPQLFTVCGSFRETIKLAGKDPGSTKNGVIQKRAGGPPEAGVESMVRYNKVIELLEQGKPVFCSGMVWNGSLEDLAFVADSDYDMTIIEMEHQDFNFDKLRMSLQFLLSRKKIAEGGSLQASPVPLVRVPPNVRERNQWVLKQALDTGVYGLVLPHLNTVEAAPVRVRRTERAGCRRDGRAGIRVHRRRKRSGTDTGPVSLPLSREDKEGRDARHDLGRRRVRIPED